MTIAEMAVRLQAALLKQMPDCAEAYEHPVDSVSVYIGDGNCVISCMALALAVSPETTEERT